jgi:hypothetical protein
MMRRLVLLFAALVMLYAPAPACAQYSGALGLSGLPGMSSFFAGNGIPSGSVIPRQEGFYLTAGLRKYVNSFTSKQFPSPPWSELRSDPESRLEFPWEQTFGVVKLGSIYKGIQVNFEGAATLFTYSGLKEQDSDWFDPNNTNQKIVFSEANDFPRCWTFDTSIGYRMPSFSSVQWLVGYRAQKFGFTNTDGFQTSLWEQYNWGAMPGEGTQFTQYYKIYYFGGAVYSQLPYSLFAKVSGDVGTVTANNVDYHVRRTPAPRFDYQATRGICWHLDIALEFRLKDFAKLGLVGDFMSITSNGGHHLTDPVTDESWDGAKVWSEQKYIELNGTLIF